MTEIRKARLTGIRVPVPVEALEARLSRLPEGVTVEPDRIEVRFGGPQEAVGRLFALAQAARERLRAVRDARRGERGGRRRSTAREGPGMLSRSDPDYAGFLDRLPRLREVYDRRLHQWMLTTARGDSLQRIETYFRDRVYTVTEINRQLLRRVNTFVDYVDRGMPIGTAVRQAWKRHPDPRGIPDW